MRGRIVDDQNNEEPSLQERLASALGDVFRDGDDAMVLGYVVLAKVLDGEGEQALHTLASTGLAPWETYGMLKFATVREEAEQHQRWQERGQA